MDYSIKIEGGELNFTAKITNQEASRIIDAVLMLKQAKVAVALPSEKKEKPLVEGKRRGPGRPPGSGKKAKKEETGFTLSGQTHPTSDTPHIV